MSSSQPAHCIESKSIEPKRTEPKSTEPNAFTGAARSPMADYR
jgi:hypothetical protein